MNMRYLIQISLLFGFSLLAWWLLSNAQANLSAQGIASGFDFLSDRSGFSIIQRPIPYTEDSSYFQAFLVGLSNTLIISLLGIFFATILGILCGIGRLSKHSMVKGFASFYVETLRNVPLLLQVFVWYFVVLRSLPHPRSSFTLFNFSFNNRGLYVPWPEQSLLFVLWAATLLGLFIWTIGRPSKSKISMMILASWSLLCFFFSYSIPTLQGFNFEGGGVLIPEFMALWIALTTYTAAFIAEITKAGITSVHPGQLEAAQALGLSKNQTLRWIIIPQALKVMIPPLTSQFLNLSKNSSLAAAIAYPDLVSVFAGTVLNQTGQAVEVILLTMSSYLILSLCISVVMNQCNKKLALSW